MAIYIYLTGAKIFAKHVKRKYDDFKEGKCNSSVLLDLIVCTVYFV